MKFLCLGWFNPAKMDALPKADVEALMSSCGTHVEKLRATGRVLVEAGVDVETRRLRRENGQLRIGQGPAPGAAEMIGCALVVEARDIEEAVQLAALHPTTQVAAGEALGWRMEVRPVHTWTPAGA